MAVKLSLRLPPTTDPATAAQAVNQVFEADPPYGAKMSFILSASLGGWNAPTLKPCLAQSMQAASAGAVQGSLKQPCRQSAAPPEKR
ncbi:MAG: hypothetical protein Q8J96_07470 [Rhodocyclaceae bacterium]|nr:hypothetical protein [Rhodocyclaceae bacterium]